MPHLLPILGLPPLSLVIVIRQVLIDGGTIGYVIVAYRQLNQPPALKTFSVAGMGVSEILPVFVFRAAGKFLCVTERHGFMSQLCKKMCLPQRRVDIVLYHSPLKIVKILLAIESVRMRHDALQFPFIQTIEGAAGMPDPPQAFSSSQSAREDRQQ
jgi:hypothetical protein